MSHITSFNDIKEWYYTEKHKNMKLKIINNEISRKSRYLGTKTTFPYVTHGLKKKSRRKSENILDSIIMKTQHVKIVG